jgi:hypothetical protein
MVPVALSKASGPDIERLTVGRLLNCALCELVPE